MNELTLASQYIKFRIKTVSFNARLPHYEAVGDSFLNERRPHDDAL